jgi:general secretion pathway protein I
MRRARGFTLLEVMLALALLGLALTVLIKSAAGSIHNAEEAHMMGVATDLARGKMYDIEETLLKDGFTDTDQSQEDEECFDDEGWPNVCYSYKVEEPELPSLEELQAMAQGKAQGSGSAGSGSAGSGSGLGSFDASQLPLGVGSDGLGSDSFGGGMLGSMLGVFGTSDSIDAAQGGQMIASQYSMFQEVLKVSVRKVTLTMKWKVLGSDRDMKVVAFFTDPSAMTKTMLGQTTNFLESQNAGSGSAGSDSGSSGSSNPTRPATIRGGRAGGK